MEGRRIRGWYLVIICLLATSISNVVRSQSNLEFVENKGQWDSTVAFKGTLSNGAFVLKKDGGYRMILYNENDLEALSPHPQKAGSGQFSSRKDESGIKYPLNGINSSLSDDKFTLRGHSYEVKFLNADTHLQIIPDKPLPSYNNYFIGNDKRKWASGCKVYQAVTFKNIYPFVDVRYYTSNGKLKYDIIVNPGGNLQRVAMYFDGVDGLKLRDGNLMVKTSVTDVVENVPEAYALTINNKKSVNCSYDIKGNIVAFKSDYYSGNSTLIIDPQLIFSSFTGSKSDNWGYTATYDNSGNFYSGGIVFGAGFPVSNGAFQTSFRGRSTLFDVGIMKFNPTGTNRVYATYLGGTSDEQPHSLVVDAAGNLIIAGRTNSPDFPVNQPNYGPTGGWDIFLTKLDANGSQLVGSRMIGGGGDDGVNIMDKETRCSPCDISIRRNYGDDARSEVIVDGSGNIYLASCTQSPDFPVTANAFQQTIGAVNSSGRVQDAVFIKASPDLSSIITSSFLGGNGDDAAFVLAINPSNGSIYISGATASTDFPGDKTGVIGTANNGGESDGFVSIIASDASTLLKTSYFGTTGVDLIYGIQFDRFSFPYIMGTTTGEWPVVNVGYSNAHGRQFISKLKPDLSAYVYSTVFGTVNSPSSYPNISPTAFLVDRCENVYVSGWGGSGNTIQFYSSGGTIGLPITSNAIQKTTDNEDFYFIVLKSNADSLLFASYFGQYKGNYPDHVDGGTSRFDRNGIIYQAICGNCEGGTTFPTTPGVWSPQNGTINSFGQVMGCNLVALKIAFNLAGLASGIQAAAKGIPRDTSGCVPLMVDFKDTIANAKQYIWDFNDGSAPITTTAPSTSHQYNTIGFYKVMLVAVDSSSCNISDTSYVHLRVRDDAAILGLSYSKIGDCTSLTFQFNNNSVPPAGKPFSSQSFKLDFGDGNFAVTGTQPVQHTYAAPGTYNVRLVLMDTNYCNQADSVIKVLRIATNVKAQFSTPASGCAPYTALFENTSSGGTDFIWTFGDGQTSTEVNPSHLYPTTGTYVVKLIAIDTSTCNKADSTTFSISVNDKPTSDFTASPQPPQVNTFIDFTNNSSGANKYKWLFGDGDSLITTSSIQVQHSYNASQTYNACLISFNSFGCTDTLCKPVQALISPLVDVPNAFTPNGDGVNDVISVKGFGIAKMKWMIYNRWGTLVFVSTSLNNGWNGTYNGTLQPQDVYHYILEVQMSDNTKYTRKGDITLLR
ncbi:MAG: PKD domain-containing protein [Bacteroidota bacterium]|nr:PKD domain-containing protein [Bacteroidota bacterium]